MARCGTKFANMISKTYLYFLTGANAECVQSFADYDGHRGARVSGLLFGDEENTFFSCGVDEKMLKFVYDAPAPGVYRRWAPASAARNFVYG